MPVTCTTPMHRCRDSGSPWQDLPEMAESLSAERAGILASLDLCALYHHAAARRWAGLHSKRCRLHLQASIQFARLRVDVAGAMR
jgi:hypothetical protein